MYCDYNSGRSREILSAAKDAKESSSEALRQLKILQRQQEDLQKRQERLMKAVVDLAEAFKKIAADVEEVHEALLPKSGAQNKPVFHGPGQRSIS